MINSAIQYSQAGLSVIPCKGDKTPALKSWTQYQKTAMSEDNILKLFRDATHLAIICGQVSDNAEILDFDQNAAVLGKWSLLIQEKVPGLFDKLVLERSPHGAHVAYRCPGVKIPGNTKLAMSEDNATLIETRGTGGYCLVSPSQGYELVQGNFMNMPELTPEEREILIESARELSQFIQPRAVQNKQHAAISTGSLLPGQDYDARADLRSLLLKHGWRQCGTGHDGRERWVRPGKETGYSATLTGGKVFYVFSSNAERFETGKGYSPFGVYAVLEHDGDFKKASRALSLQGYGTHNSLEPKSGIRTPYFLTSQKMKSKFGEKISFLWRDQIPKGQPVLYAGREGDGKSTTVAQISKEIVLSIKDSYILWVACEGFVSDHADKWSKLKMPDQVVMLTDNNGVYKLQLDNYKERDFLDNSIQSLKNQTGCQVVAVVIDSIRGMQMMGENDPKIAGVISAINSIVCDKHGASCIFIAHHKKGTDQKRLNQVAGTTAITSSVRAVYSIEKCSESICRIIPDKSNALGHHPVTYKSILVEEDDDHFEVIITPELEPIDQTKKGQAEKFLISLFRERAEYQVKEIYRLGAMEGLSADSLKRAKGNLSIEVVHPKYDAPWIWRSCLYIEKHALCGVTEKAESEKSNIINQGAQGAQNLPNQEELFREHREHRMHREQMGNKMHSEYISNSNNEINNESEYLRGFI